MKVVNRISRVPEYIFSRFDEIKNTLKAGGIDVIDLGIGDPDIPTPDFIISSICENAANPQNHRYPPYAGIDEFRRAVAEYYLRQYGVKLNYKTEVAALIGSKEGIAHLFMAVTDPGDYVLIPDPAYPVYNASALLTGCDVCKMNLMRENNYLPKLDNIYQDIAKKAKLLIVNYPNNPTGATADEDFFRDLVNFGKKNNIVVANDAAYINIAANGLKCSSLLQAEGAKDLAVEFGTLSKSYNMTGWRLGYVAGNEEVIKKLMVVKTNFDSGQSAAIQHAGALALNSGDDFIKYMNGIYDERRSMVKNVLKGRGIDLFESRAAFYVWFKVPESYKSEEFAAYLLEKTGVMITPGNAFGSIGEGYCRISLTTDSNKLMEAMKRLSEIKF